MVKKYKKNSSVSYTLGITLTIELLKEKLDQVTRVFVHSKINQNESFRFVEEICELKNIPLIFNDKVFNILSKKENSYLIGEFRKFEPRLEENNNHLVLVNPANAGNLGTIIRSMVGFGVHDLIIISPAVDIFDPKCIRASMGAVFHLSYTYYENFSDYYSQFTRRYYYPFMLEARSSLSKLRINEPYSLIFGNEATGLPDEYLNLGESIVIEHSNKIDSLNLPIAVSLALYEVTKDKYK